MMRIVAVVAIIGGLSVLAGHFQSNAQVADITWPWQTIHSQVTTSYAISGTGVLQVSNTSGDVYVTGGGGSTVDVTVKKSGLSQSDLDSMTSDATVDASGGHPNSGLAITTNYPHHCVNCDLSYEIRVPRGVQVKVDVDSGDVHVSGTDGLIDISSSSGDVKLSDDSGPINVEESSGDVRLTDVGGSARVKSASGGIDASGLTKDVDFNADSGDITAKFASLSGVSTIRMRTDSGSITLDMPRDFSARISALTDSGSLDSNLKLPIHDHDSGADLSVAVGNAKTNVNLVASSGDISINAR
jgi:hypothetical protein